MNMPGGYNPIPFKVMVHKGERFLRHCVLCGGFYEVTFGETVDVWPHDDRITIKRDGNTIHECQL